MDTGYLSQQVTTIINQLHGLFDEIGVPSHERDSRESEVRMHMVADRLQLVDLVSSSRHYQRLYTTN